MIMVYITAYLRGVEHISGIELPPMPAAPAIGSTLYWDDRAWQVDHVSWVWVGADDLRGSYGTEDHWHVELAVSA